MSTKTNSLAHHGIKGQKWGVKNGPPYPLSESVSAAVRKNRFNNDIGEGAHRLDFDFKTVPKQVKIETLSELDRKVSKGTALDDAYTVNNRSGLSRAGYEFNCQNCSAAFEMRRRGYDVVSRPMRDGSNVGSIESWFKDGKMTNANPDLNNKRLFKESVEDYASRKEREYKSLPLRTRLKTDKPGRYMNSEYTMELYKEQVDAYNNFINQLKSQGNGARGIATVGWLDNDYDYDLRTRTSVFHAINYEVNNGNVKFYDSQTAFKYKDRKYDGITNCGIDIEDVDPREYTYMRTDNLELNESITGAVISSSKVDKEK